MEKKEGGETESKGHSKGGKERERDWGTAANAFSRTWLLNVPVNWFEKRREVGCFHIQFSSSFFLLQPPPLFLFFFPSLLSPLPHPLTYRKHVGQPFFHILSPSFSKPKSKRNHRMGIVTLNKTAKQLCPWRKALIIPIKMLSQPSSKWGQKSQDQRQWRNTGGNSMITGL